MGSTFGYRKEGIGEHGRRRRDYYTLFAFDFFLCSQFCVLLLFIGSFFFSHIFPILFPSRDHLSHTYLLRLIVDQIVRCRFLFFFSFPFFPFSFLPGLGLFILSVVGVSSDREKKLKCFT